MASPFDVFRKPHDVRLWLPDTVDEGVVSRGGFLTSSIRCSVQRLGRTEIIDLTTRGKRVSDVRRIFTASKLPVTGEPVLGTSQRIIDEADIIDNASGFAIDFEFDPVPLKKCPAAWVMVEGRWFEVGQRIPMQNGIINHFEYRIYRVTENV